MHKHKLPESSNGRHTAKSFSGCEQLHGKAVKREGRNCTSQQVPPRCLSPSGSGTSCEWQGGGVKSLPRNQWALLNRWLLPRNFFTSGDLNLKRKWADGSLVVDAVSATWRADRRKTLQCSTISLGHFRKSLFILGTNKSLKDIFRGELSAPGPCVTAAPCETIQSGWRQYFPGWICLWSSQCSRHVCRAYNALNIQDNKCSSMGAPTESEVCLVLSHVGLWAECFTHCLTAP